MATTYIGVPNGSYTPGQPVITGGGGPTTLADYGTHPVYLADGTRLTDPSTVIMPNETVYIDAPPVGGGGTAETGTQIPLDAASIANILASAGLSNAQASNYGAVNAQNAQNETDLQQYRMAQLDQAKQQAAQQFQIDSANLGLSAATANYQQRLGVINAQFQQENIALNANQFNAGQAGKEEASRENILNMLAARSGPQDWVKYNNLLNGLNAPNPQKTTTIDPFAGLDAAFPKVDVPTGPDLSSLYQPYQVNLNGGGVGQMTSAQQQAYNLPATPTSNNSNAGSLVTPQAQSSALPTQPYMGGAFAANPNTSQGWPTGWLTGEQPPIAASAPNQQTTASGGHIDVATGQWVPGAGDNNSSQYPQGSPTATLMPDGTIKRMATGGTVAAQAVVGDTPSGKPDGHEEVAQAILGPNGQPELHVIPHNQAKSLIADSLPGAKQKTNADLDAAIAARGAKGGTFKPSAGDILLGRDAQDGGGSSSPPSPPAAGDTSPSPQSGDLLSKIPPEVLQMLVQAILQMAKSGGPGGMGMPGGAPGGLPRAASGGTYGTDLNNNSVTVSQYSPSDLGNQPFYQKLIGNQPNRGFGAFGADLSNPQLGLNNVNPNISLQRYNALLPSEQQQTNDLFGTGLAVDPNDILQMAKNAAPTTRNYQTYGTAIQSNQYGG